MVDRSLILAKVSSVNSHLKRVKEKTNTELNTFLKNHQRLEMYIFIKKEGKSVFGN